MQKRDFFSILLLILLFIVFTAPGSVQITSGTDTTYSSGQKPTGIFQNNNFWDNMFPDMSGMAVTLTATKTDALLTDNNSNSEFDPGDVISYTIVIQNSGDTAENVVFDDTIDPNTTEVAGSLSVTPIARNDSYATTGNISISVPDGAGDVLGNDNDPDGGTLTVTAVQGSAGNVGSATITTATGLNSVKGSVTMLADGSFSYEPPPGFTGTDTFTYQVTDDEGDTDEATVTISITDTVWFIDNSSSGSNLGTFSDPFTSITSFNSAQGASTPNPTDSDVIFVYQGSGNYNDGIILRNSQILLGQGIDLLSELGSLGITQSPFSNLASSPTSGAGNRPTLTDGSGNGIALASANTIKGLTVGNTSGIGVTGSNVGNLTIDEMGITGPGKAFDVNGGGTLNIALDEVTVTSSVSGGFSLQNVNGTTTLSNVDITTTGGTGLLASSAGTFTVTGTNNQISSNSGTAVNLTNTIIGNGGATFRSISSSGGSSSGLILNNTGNSGVFEVTGNGSILGSGGSIQNKSGGGDGTDGINMNNVSNVRLRYMNVNNNNKNGIFGQSVNGLILDNVVIDNNSNQVSPDEAGLHLLEFTGTGSAGSNPAMFSNITVKDSHEHNVKIQNINGVLNVNVNNSTFSNDGSSTQAGSNFLFLGEGSANMTLVFDNNTVTGNDTAGQLTAFGLQADASAGIMDVNVTNSTFNKNNVGVGVSISGSANTTFDISNNSSITRNRANGVNIFTNASSTGSMSGQITNNTIGTSGVTGSGSALGSGIRVSNEGPVTTTVLIDGNTVQEVADFEGIFISESVNAGSLNATITNNNIRDTDFDRGLQMILISEGTACSNISGNTFTNIGGISDMRVRQTSGIFNVTQANPTGAAPNLSTVNNNASVTVSGSINFSQAACSTPAKTISDAGFDLSPANIAQSDSYRIYPETVNYDQEIVLAESATTKKEYSDTKPNTALTIERDPVYLASAESTGFILPNESGTESLSRTIPGKTQNGTATVMFSGENINISLGTLDPGQEVTIEFQATIDDPLPSGVDRVQNQATISGDNFSDILTTDPSPNSGFPPTAGETITPLNIELDLSLMVDEGWRMLSSPIDGLTYETMLGDLWTQGSGTTGTDYDGGPPNVYTWPNDATGTDPGTWASLANLSQTIPAGSGFLMYVFTDDVYNQDPAGEFPKTITISGLTHSGDISPDMNSTADGWTLAGNPYIVPVDFGALTTTNLTGVAYVYDSNLSGVGDPGPTNSNTGGWRTTDGNFGDLTDGIIAPGQGFLVQNAGAAGSLTFTEASKTTGGQFYGKQKEPALSNFMRLEVQGESGYNAVWIRFSGEGSVEPIYGDAIELQPLSDHYALLGARKVDGTLFDIAHFPFPHEDLVVPLAVEATQGGRYTITATRMDLPAGTGLYLHDLETGEITAIDPSLEYHFTLGDSQKSASTEMISALESSPAKATTSGADRFVITTSASADLPDRELPEQVALEQNYPNPFNPSTVISYQLPVSSDVRLEIYDMLGRRMATLVDGQVAAGTHQVSFNASNLSSGVYLYKLTAGNTTITKKLTVLK